VHAAAAAHAAADSRDTNHGLLGSTLSYDNAYEYIQGIATVVTKQAYE